MNFNSKIFQIWNDVKSNKLSQNNLKSIFYKSINI